MHDILHNICLANIFSHFAASPILSIVSFFIQFFSLMKGHLSICAIVSCFWCLIQKFLTHSNTFNHFSCFLPVISKFQVLLLCHKFILNLIFVLSDRKQSNNSFACGLPSFTASFIEKSILLPRHILNTVSKINLL